MPSAYTENPIFCRWATSRTPPSITAPEKFRDMAVPDEPPIPAMSMPSSTAITYTELALP